MVPRLVSSVLLVLCVCACAEALVTAPPIRTKEQYGGRPATRVINSNSPVSLVIHHTASPMSSYTGDATIRATVDYHMLSRGYSDVGYHLIIGPDGVIYQGRPLNVQGAHAGGANVNTAGICLVGNFHAGDVVTPEARQSLVWVMAWIGETYGFSPSGNTRGHRDAGTTPTACPGDAFYALLPEITTEATNLIAVGGSPGNPPPGQDSTDSDGSSEVRCASPGTFNDQLGTCTDDRNTGNCVASAADCPGGVAREVGECAVCCFSSDCGCNEPIDELRAAPSLGPCSASDGRAGVCVDAATTDCPSGNLISSLCPNIAEGDNIQCCIDKEIDCDAPLVPTAVSIPMFLIAAGGLTAAGVTKFYDTPANKDGKREGATKKESKAEFDSFKPVQEIRSKSKSSTASKGSSGKLTQASSLTRSKNSTGSKGSRSSKSSKNSKRSKGSKGSKHSRSSNNSKSSRGGKGRRPSNQSSHSKTKKSKGSTHSRSSKNSKGSRGGGKKTGGSKSVTRH